MGVAQPEDGGEIPMAHRGPQPQTPEEYNIEIYGILNRLEEKLDSMCSQSTNHETRIKTLEDERIERAGQSNIIQPIIQGGITIILASITAWLTGFIHH
jgi:hypothetical protein